MMSVLHKIKADLQELAYIFFWQGETECYCCFIETCKRIKVFDPTFYNSNILFALLCAESRSCCLDSVQTGY